MAVINTQNLFICCYFLNMQMKHYFLTPEIKGIRNFIYVKPLELGKIISDGKLHHVHCTPEIVFLHDVVLMGLNGPDTDVELV